MSNAYKDYQPPAGGGMYLKLEDGQSAKIRISSEPYVFQNKFDENISTRYAWVVFNYDEDKAQVFQQGVRGYKAIANLATDDDWGDPTTFDIKVTRKGSGTDTVYHMTPSPFKEKLDTEQKEAVEAVKMEDYIKNAIPLEAAVSGVDIPAATERENEPLPEPQGEGEPDFNLDDME